MTDAMWTTIFQAVGLLMTGIFIPWAITVYQKRTAVNLTDQERSAVYHAADTAAGILETMIHQGKAGVAQITPDHPIVLQQAADALAPVYDAGKAQGVTVKSLARIIAGRVDTGNAMDVATARIAAFGPPKPLAVPDAAPAVSKGI